MEKSAFIEQLKILLYVQKKGCRSVLVIIIYSHLFTLSKIKRPKLSARLVVVWGDHIQIHFNFALSTIVWNLWIRYIPNI